MAILRAGLMLVLLLAAWPATATDAEAKSRRIVVMSNGWHTAIALARGDLPRGAIPEVEDFPDATHFEFGWGDAEYFPAKSPSIGMALRAAAPGPAVLHLVGLRDHPARVFPAAEAIDVALSDSELRRLVAYVADSIDRGRSARAEPVAPGLYADSRFYPATGRFHLFNTCNTWTARGLAAAGLPLDAAGVQTADDLVVRLRVALQRTR